MRTTGITSAEPAMTVSRSAGPTRRALPVALFSIPLGLAGLGGAWSAASQLLGASDVPADVTYAASTVVYIAFTTVYVVGTVRSEGGGFRDHLRHPLFGPLTAYLPVIAILLVAHYAADLGEAARWLCFGAVVALSINGAALLAHWLRAPLDHDALHPGYFLPLVAGPFIASIGLASVGDRMAAVAVFGVGVYFWLLLGAIITGRLFFGAPLPQPSCRSFPSCSHHQPPRALPGSLSWMGTSTSCRRLLGASPCSRCCPSSSFSPTTCGSRSALNTGSSPSRWPCWAASGFAGPQVSSSRAGSPPPGQFSLCPRPPFSRSSPARCGTAVDGCLADRRQRALLRPRARLATGDGPVIRPVMPRVPPGTLSAKVVAPAAITCRLP